MRFITIFGLILLMAFVPVSTTAETGYVAKNLAQAQFTTRVNKRVPVNDIKNLSTEFNKVFFFTDIRDCIACRVEHQWWFKGNKVSSVDGKVKYSRYRWWTSKTLADDMIGDWTAKLVINGKVIFSKTFTYYKPTRVQIQQAPVQQRIQIEESGECEIQLRHFSGELRDNPDDPYIKFMLDKWDKRCSGK